jgi:hypothetical protein
MIRAANTILATRSLFDASAPGEEGELLSQVNVIRTLRNDIISPAERTLRNKAQQVVREFSMSNLSGSTTYAQTEDTKSRTTSALQTLYLLSSTPSPRTSFTAELMIASLQEYLRTSLTSSLASLIRALGTLPTLERTLLEISARCQNIVALELLLESIKPPTPTSSTPATTHAHSSQPINFLAPLLAALETSSLPSYFWRSLGSSLSPRVQEMINKGGVQARTLRSNKNGVRDMIRECVVRGSQAPQGIGKEKGARKSGSEGWEREVAVMVGAVVGHLGR